MKSVKIIPSRLVKTLFSYPIFRSIGIVFLLSWLYALASQIIIPLPFNAVPLSLQPFPVLLLSLLIGAPAIYAYLLYLFQGAVGAPFFAGMNGGLIHLMGPTGGYLIGFCIGGLFLVITRRIYGHSLVAAFIKIELANILVFAYGIGHLAQYVPTEKLLSFGLYPFFLGDFVLKTAGILFILYVINNKNKNNKFTY